MLWGPSSKGCGPENISARNSVIFHPRGNHCHINPILCPWKWLETHCWHVAILRVVLICPIRFNLSKHCILRVDRLFVLICPIRFNLSKQCKTRQDRVLSDQNCTNSHPHAWFRPKIAANIQRNTRTRNDPKVWLQAFHDYSLASDSGVKGVIC